jgi:hypothetical protein
MSCSTPKYELIETEIIDGKVSAIKPGDDGRYGVSPTLPKIWVQNATNTVQVSVPFEYEDRWQVGDDCLLIIEKYKENETK